MSKNRFGTGQTNAENYSLRNLKRPFGTVALLCLLLSSSLILPSCATTRLHSEPVIHTHGQLRADMTGTSLRVMTLNLAHGRGNGFHQLFQDAETAIANLTSVSALLNRENPDLVSLQEADSRSFWSGNFDHVTFLAKRGSYGRSVRGTHVDALGLSYGTALMAKLDLGQPEAITFPPALSPVPKGFVVSTIRWPGRDDHEVDVVSVHLDFTSESIRIKQATELVEKLKRRNRPLIVMGDFNTDWQEDYSALRYVARELSLSPYDPESIMLDTFPAFGERLDWILISPGIRFQSYRVVPDVVSDHRGVVAELVLQSAIGSSKQGGNSRDRRPAPSGPSAAHSTQFRLYSGCPSVITDE